MEFINPFDPATGGPGDGSVPWQNENLLVGQEGSNPPAEAFEHPMREITNVIDHYLGDGTEGSGQAAGDLTQLLQSIQAATAGLALLPIQAQVEGNGGRLQMDGAGTGDRVISAGQTITWRGHRAFAIDDYTLAERTVNVPVGTHHLRWSPGAGFALQSLADGAYNPSALGEEDSTFDSAYDDVLLGRFVEGLWTPAILRSRRQHRFRVTGTGQVLLPFGYRDRKFRLTAAIRNTGSSGDILIPSSGTSEFGQQLLSMVGGTSSPGGLEYAARDLLLSSNSPAGEFSITSATGLQYGNLVDLQGHQSEHSASTAESDEQLLMQGRRTMSEAEYLGGMPLDYAGVDEAILDFEVLN